MRFTLPGGGASSDHTIYCQRHVVRQKQEQLPSGFTLFSLGWPPYCSTQCLEELFSRAGQVQGAYLQPHPGPVGKSDKPAGGFLVGYVVFSSQEEVTAALGLCGAREPVLCTVAAIGMPLWCRQYREERIPVVAMETAVEGCVRQYDARKAGERKKGRLSQPDEEGWVTVVGRRPRPQTTRQERRKHKRHQEPDFYLFQQREAQRQQVARLRQRFQEDKQRVAEMKARRRFRPF